MTTTSKLRALKKKFSSRKPKKDEWLRLAEMPEPARSSPHRAYWVCARFLCAMHSLATCGRLVKDTREREAGVWCNAVVDLGVKACEKAGLRHLEVFNLAYEYAEFHEPFDAGLLAGLRDELVIEERDRWDMLTKREQRVLQFIAEEAGDVGLGASEIADSLGRGKDAIKCFKPASKSTSARARPDRIGKALLSGLLKRGFLAPAGGGGGHFRYKLGRKPAGWPEQ